MNIKNLFDNLANKYDFMNNIISFGTHKFIKKLAIKELNIKPNSKVLDLCCGTGDLGSIIKETEPTCDITGVDFSENMLEIARKRNPKNTYWNFDTTNLPFEKNSFDYIVMGFGLRNIVQKNKALEEIHRILKPNGTVICANADFDSITLNGKDKELIRNVIHSYAITKQPWMDDLDSWMGRRTYSIFNKTNLSSKFLVWKWRYAMGRCRCRVTYCRYYAKG